MWYQKSVRDDLIEKILSQIPKSWRRMYDVKKYAHDYAYSLKSEPLTNPSLIIEGRDYVFRKIKEEKEKIK